MEKDNTLSKLSSPQECKGRLITEKSLNIIHHIPRLK